METVLFLCVENSFRSQIAEAYFNKYAPKGWRGVSAGIKPADRVHSNAVKLMLEEGIDISHKKPMPISGELEEKADVVVIVCSGSQCPVVYAKYVEEWSIPDPAKMPLYEARKIRGMIRSRVLDLIERLKKHEYPGHRFSLH